MKKIILLVFSVMLGITMVNAQTTSSHEAVSTTLQNAKDVLDKQNDLYGTPMRTGQELYTHCYEESLDVRGESMGGFGIAEGHLDRNSAKEEANRNAIADIASRYAGVLTNSVKQYYEASRNSDGYKYNESELTSKTTIIGEQIINKYAEQMCFKYEKDVNGMYTCYVAVQVPLDVVVEQTVEETSTLLPQEAMSAFELYLKTELDKIARTANQ
jgi:hypothetical protein